MMHKDFLDIGMGIHSTGNIKTLLSRTFANLI